MKRSADIDPNLHNTTNHNQFKYHKLKILTINVNGLNNLSKRNKIFNFLKTNKIDITLMEETHSTRNAEKQWQKGWDGMSFWNSGPTHQTAGIASLFSENFQGKIQIIKNDYTGRIPPISFALNKQLFNIVNIYGASKPYQRENFFQYLNDFTINTQNTIIGGDFNMVEELKDRLGGAVNNTHLLGSENLKTLIRIQNLHDTWRKVSLEKDEFTYHRNQSNIHSRLDRIYATKTLPILTPKILPFQHSDHEALLTEFPLRVRIRGPGFWKLNTSILTHETFKKAFKNF